MVVIVGYPATIGVAGAAIALGILTIKLDLAPAVPGALVGSGLAYLGFLTTMLVF